MQESGICLTANMHLTDNVHLTTTLYGTTVVIIDVNHFKDDLES